MKKSIIFLLSTTFWIFSQSFSTESQIIPITDTNDINKNGQPDFLAFSGNGLYRTVYLYEISDDGPFEFWKYSLSPAKEGFWIDAIIGDFDGNGIVELILVSSLENSSDSFYIFELIGDSFGPVPQKITKFPNSSISALRPTKVHKIKWDSDESDEFLIIVSSPERCGYICDYKNNEIVVIKRIGKEFLAKNYSPILSAVGDLNNDKLDDIVLINNSNSPEGQVFLNGVDSTHSIDFPHGKVISLSVSGNGNISFTNSKDQVFKVQLTDSLFVTELSEEACKIDLSENASTLFFAEETPNIKSLFLKQSEMLVLTHGEKNPEIVFFKLQDDVIEEKQSSAVDSVNKSIDFVVNNGDLFEFQLQQNDSAKFLSFESNSMPNGMKFDIENFAISWLPNTTQLDLRNILYSVAYRKTGNLKEINSNNIQKIILEEENYTVIDSFSVYVNYPPVFSNNLSEFSLVSGDLFEYKFNVLDHNINPNLSFYFIADTSNLLELSQDGSVRVETTDDLVGNNNFPLVVTDGFASDTTSFTLIVHPKIVLESNRIFFNVNVGDELKISVSPENGDITNKFVFELDEAPENMRINQKGTILWIPTSTQIDTQKFIVSVADDYTQSSLGVSVYVNVAPIISSRPSDVTIIENNTEREFILGSFDANSNAVLTWNLLNAPDDMIIDSLGILKFNPDSLGWFEYSIELSDGISSTKFNGNIYVNSTPKITGKPPVFTTCGELYNYSLNVADSNLTSPLGRKVQNKLHYQLIDSPEGVVVDSNGVVSWEPSQTQFGDFSFKIMASDGAAFAEQNINIFVNSLPKISSNDSVAVQIGNEVIHKILVEDINLNDTLIYSIAELPIEFDFDSTQGIIRWTPTTELLGNHQINIQVSDRHPGGEDNQLLKLFIYDLPKFNNKPPKEAFMGLEYKFKPLITDFTGDGNISFTVENPSSERIILDKPTNSILWIPDSSDVGEQSFSIKAIDRFGLTTTEKFDIKVLENPCHKCGEDETEQQDNKQEDVIIEPIIQDSLIVP